MRNYVGFDFLNIKEKDFVIKRVRKLENKLRELGQDKTIDINNNTFELDKLKKINKLHEKIS